MQIVEHYAAALCGRVVTDQLTERVVLHHCVVGLGHGVFAGYIAEINFAAGGNIEIVRDIVGTTIHLIAEYADLPFGRHANQTFVGIANNQIARGVKLHTQRVAAGIGQHLGVSGAIESCTHHITVD